MCERKTRIFFFVYNSQCIHVNTGSLGPKVIHFISRSTQLSMKTILLINVKMPTVVGILTFIMRINTAPRKLKSKKNLHILVLMNWLPKPFINPTEHKTRHAHNCLNANNHSY